MMGRGWTGFAAVLALLLAAALAWCHRMPKGVEEERPMAGRIGQSATGGPEAGESHGVLPRTARKPLPKTPKMKLGPVDEFRDQVDSEEAQRSKPVDEYEDEGATVFVFEVGPPVEDRQAYVARWREKMPQVESVGAMDLMMNRLWRGFIPANRKRFVKVRVEDEGRKTTYTVVDVGTAAVWSRIRLPTNSTEIESGEGNLLAGYWRYRRLMEQADASR